MKNKELPFIREMFENIAPKYDFLNRLLSLRQDVYWRKVMVREIHLPEKAAVLDVACGTGDVLLEIVRCKPGQINAVGVDFSLKMLELGHIKVKKAGYENQISLAAADAFHLPFRQESYNAITIAFGIRNIQDKLRVLHELNLMLKPEGQILILELSSPKHQLFQKMFLLYFQRLLPLIGRLFSGNDSAYQYLPDSVMNFPPAAQFAHIMEIAGFKQVKWRHLTLGIATLFVGKK